MNPFFAFMRSCGWNVEKNEHATYHMPDFFKTRYKNTPQSWLEFAGSVKCIVTHDESAWFLCAADFAPQADSAFQWNEWELISLGAAEDDANLQANLAAFWNTHLPVFMSVKGVYSYYAISMENGSIVYGSEPEFEECRTVAESFEEFLSKIIHGQIKL